MKLIYKNKKGVSEVIVTVIMIALVLAAGVIVWGVVNNLVRNQLGGAESCFGIFEKITLDNLYTCYDGDSDEIHFSINIGDIEVEKVIVGISGEGVKKSYTIPGNYSDVKEYGGTYGEDLELPGQNGGLTYIASGFTSAPDRIQIAPVIDGKQCEISDSLSEIDDCLLLA